MIDHPPDDPPDDGPFIYPATLIPGSGDLFEMECECGDFHRFRRRDVEEIDPDLVYWVVPCEAETGFGLYIQLPKPATPTPIPALGGWDDDPLRLV